MGEQSQAALEFISRAYGSVKILDREPWELREHWPLSMLAEIAVEKCRIPVWEVHSNMTRSIL